MKIVCKIAVILVVSMNFFDSAFAQKEKNKSLKKVNVQSLEKRYWAPKDKKFKIIQNRTYTKTKKLALTLMPVLMLNEEYSKGLGTNLAAGYYFNDRWGIELEYQLMELDDNELQIELIKLGGFANHGKTTSYLGASVRWMPFYAKMSFLGSRIVYFDLSLGLTVGRMNYDQQLDQKNSRLTTTLDKKSLEKSARAFGFDVSQSFYMSKRFILRVDYKHRFYKQDLIIGGTQNPGGSAGSRQEDSSSLNLGLTYLL